MINDCVPQKYSVHFLTNCNIFIVEAIACRGDVIGCTVKFDKNDAGKLAVVFTLNGKQITQDEIVMEYDPFNRLNFKVYPYICMGHSGMTVLAKVSRFQTRSALFPN